MIKSGQYRCAHCQQAITSGTVIDALGKKYHANHFFCSRCKNEITSAGFAILDDEPVCKSCTDQIKGSIFTVATDNSKSNNSTPSSKTCPGCGKAVHGVAKFCSSCGTPLAKVSIDISDILDEPKKKDEEKLKQEQEKKKQEEAKLKREKEEQEKKKKEEEEKARKEKEELEKQKKLQEEDKQRKLKEEQEKKAKEEQVRKEKEEQERKVKEEQIRKEKEEKEKREKEDQARKLKEEQEKKAKEEQARKAKEEQEKKAKEEQERKVKEEQERKAKEEQIRKEKEEREKREKEEQEKKAKEEQARKLKEEQEKKAKEEQIRREKEDQERKAKEEQIRKEKEEKEKREKEEQAKKLKEEQEKKAKEEQARKAKEEQEKKAKEEQERKSKEDQARKEKEEREKREKEEQAKKAKEEQIRKEKEEREKREKEEQEKKAKEEQARKLKEEQEKKAKEEQERKVKEDQQRKAKEEQEKKIKEEQAKKAKEEQDRKVREEQARKEKEEQDKQRLKGKLNSLFVVHTIEEEEEKKKEVAKKEEEKQKDERSKYGSSKPAQRAVSPSPKRPSSAEPLKHLEPEKRPASSEPIKRPEPEKRPASPEPKRPISPEPKRPLSPESDKRPSSPEPKRKLLPPSKIPATKPPPPAKVVKNPPPPSSPPPPPKKMESPASPPLERRELKSQAIVSPEEERIRGFREAAIEEIAKLKLDPSEKMRVEVVAELLLTETTYVRDLDRIQKNFLRPIQEDKILSKEECDSLFSNVDSISKVNQELLNSLNKDLDQTKNIRNMNIGAIFLQIADYLKMYSIYSSNQANSIKCFETFKKEKKDFGTFLIVAEARPECQGLNLMSYLIKPIQRICKYPLLFKELLKHTPEQHPDREMIQKSLSKVQEVADYVNEKQKTNESLRKMVEISTSLTDAPKGFTLVAPARRFLREGTLTKINLRGKQQDRLFFLFNDVLLYCKPPVFSSPTFQFKGCIPLQKCLVTDIPDSKVMLFVFILIFVDLKNQLHLVNFEDKRKYILLAPSIEEKRAWLSDLGKITEQFLSKTEKSRPTLSSDWIEYAADDGTPYWYNTKTQESTWNNPISNNLMASTKSPNLMASKRKTEAPSREASNAADWEELTTEDGYKYWYNKVTNITTWDNPNQEWLQATTEKGEKYYYNPKTGETKWNL